MIGEAMSCGTPCVVTDVGDSERIVGGTGVVVPASDPEEMVAGWRKILLITKEEREALGQKARERICAEFSLTHLIERTNRGFERLLNTTLG